MFLLGWFATPAIAQYEISKFKLVDVSADLLVGYTLDDREWPNNFTQSAVWREELKFATRSYVYHPALLDMYVSGGPVLVQAGYESSQGDSSGRDTLFDYNASLNFLERKSYPFTIYLRRDHPEVTTGLLGRYITKTDEYGARGTIRPSLLPASVFWDVGHWESAGSGFGSTVDENVDRAAFRTSLPYGDLQSLAMDVNWFERRSASGSPGLPIQESEINTLTARLGGNNTFGEQRRVRLTQNLRLLQQETRTTKLTEIERWSYTGSLWWNHSDSSRSSIDYRFTDQDRTESRTRAQDLVIGTGFRPDESLVVSGKGRYSSTEELGFTRNIVGVQADATYTVPLVFGRLSISGFVQLDRTDQQASRDTANVFDESQVLTGVVPQELNEQFIVAESVNVTNVAQTQTFLEEIDYRLVVIGSTTTIERIVTGSIIDGQEVLVSYAYRTGGTADYDTRNESLGFDLSIFKYASIYLRFGQSRNDIRGGVVTTTLNDVDRFEAGGTITFPLPRGWSMGADYRYTNQNEDISPFVRNSYDVYAQTANYWGTTMRFGVHGETVDYEVSREDVDLVRYFVDLSCRLPGASALTYRFVDGKDDGGSVIREDVRHSLRFDWRYRSVMFSLRADQAEIAQGESRRDNTRVVAELRRRF